MPQNSQNKFAVVIPAYNEEATIYDVTTRAISQCETVIVVDDGSKDSTAESIQGLPVKLIQHKHNMGKAASLWDGFMAAMNSDIDFIITLDGDGQHAPEDIPLLIAESILYPNQIIIGARLANKADIPAKRYYANKIANFWIAWAAGYPLSDSQSGFRLYPVSLFKDLTIATSKDSSFVFESEIIIKAAQRGIRSQPVPIPAVYAENARPSHFRGVRDITLITLMVAKSLFSRGMYLQGLYRSAIKPMLLPAQEDKPDYDGYLMLLFSLVLLFVSGGLSFLLTWIYIFQAARKKTDDCSQNDILIVPGKRLTDDLPDSDFIERLNRAVTLLSGKNAKQVYILGGKTHNSDISEASAGKIFLTQKGINPQQIFLEEESRNTLENFKRLFSISQNKEQKVSLITNRYHLARSLIMARGFGINAQPYPAEETFSYTIRNILKTLTEAFHLHWYLTGKYLAIITNNKRIKNRIS